MKQWLGLCLSLYRLLLELNGALCTRQSCIFYYECVTLVEHATATTLLACAYLLTGYGMHMFIQNEEAASVLFHFHCVKNKDTSFIPMLLTWHVRHNCKAVNCVALAGVPHMFSPLAPPLPPVYSPA